MSYWTQQLNFAVWCTMTGCGISREVLDNVPEQVKSFLMIHIHLTVRKIIFEMGGIQSESALPGDPTFSQISNNNYDMPSFERICAELESYQEMTSASKEMTSVFIYVSYVGPEANLKFSLVMCALFDLCLNCYANICPITLFSV